ncbi:hypothetical protein UPYG_G00322010 [Umbra pygmaea]|uniref:Uncharacterized protein n=1 Tax=Umbra pygmaea TaxID=75934 RepID=A0ABD0W0L1_UMBPY
MPSSAHSHYAYILSEKLRRLLAMAFLKKFLANDSGADKYVDQAVDTAAKAAKQKVKNMMAGEKKPASGSPEVKPTAGVDEPKKPSSGVSGGTEVTPVVGGADPKKPSSAGTSVGIGGATASTNVAVDDNKSSVSGGADFDLTDSLADIANDMSIEK